MFSRWKEIIEIIKMKISLNRNLFTLQITISHQSPHKAEKDLDLDSKRPSPIYSFPNVEV